MFSYFSDPDLRKEEGGVMLQSVQWNSELKETYFNKLNLYLSRKRLFFFIGSISLKFFLQLVEKPQRRYEQRIKKEFTENYKTAPKFGDYVPKIERYRHRDRFGSEIGLYSPESLYGLEPGLKAANGRQRTSSLSTLSGEAFRPDTPRNLE